MIGVLVIFQPSVHAFGTHPICDAIVFQLHDIRFHSIAGAPAFSFKEEMTVTDYIVYAGKIVYSRLETRDIFH